MARDERLTYLRVAMVAVGIIFIAGIYPLMIIWPSGWTWHTGHSDYPMMIVGVYATLGVFLIMGARDPMANLSLIWFTVMVEHRPCGDHGWCSHLRRLRHHGHLMGDVPALIVVAIVLAVLTPRGGMVQSRVG